MTNNNYKICRACLCDDEELLLSLLDNPSTLAIYASCTYLQVDIKDGLPMNLCSSCVNKCISWNSFKKMCTINESLLLSELDCRKYTINETNDSELIIIEDQPERPESTDCISVEDHLGNSYLIRKTELVDGTTTTITTKTRAEIKNEMTIEEFNLHEDQIECYELSDTTTSSEQLDQWMPEESASLNGVNNYMAHNDQILISPQENMPKLKLRKRKRHKRAIIIGNTATATTTFQCEICEKSFQFKSQITNHMINHSNNKPFKCIVCSKAFKSNQLLILHTMDHTGERPFPCTKCDESFKSKFGLQKHFKMHLTNPCECLRCGLQLKNKFNLKIHMLNHSTEEKPYKCQLCNANFKDNFTLTIHKRNHTGERPFSCTKCGTSFTSNAALKQHTQIKRSCKRRKCRIKKTSNLCTFCGKNFKYNAQLIAHLRKHTGERPFLCEICQKRFKLKSHLDKHLLVHLRKPCLCEICGRNFENIFQIKLHMFTEHYSHHHHNIDQINDLNNKQFVCRMCDKSFKSELKLSRHIFSHTGERPFKCRECNRRFMKLAHLNMHSKRIHMTDKEQQQQQQPLTTNTQILLKQHMKTHSANNENPFECDVCNEKFTNKQNLVNHVKLHKNQIIKIEFQCKICYEPFTAQADLKLHMKSHSIERPRRHTRSNNLKTEFNI